MVNARFCLELFEYAIRLIDGGRDLYLTRADIVHQCTPSCGIDIYVVVKLLRYDTKQW